MRILLIHNQYKHWGGEDVVFKSEYDLLLKNGHEVDKLVYDNSIIETTFDKIKSGLRLIYNPDSAHDVGVKIRDFKPDVIHVHNILPQVSPSVFYVAKKWKIPLVLTLHNYRLICPSATLFYEGKIYEKSINSIFPFDAVWKGVYRNSRIQTAALAFMTAIHNIIGTWRNHIDCYITLTQFAKRKFISSALSIPKNKFVVKPNFAEDCGRGADHRENYFLYVGKLAEEKGTRTLLKAAQQHDFNLTIIGDGPLKGLVEESAKHNSSINYLGYQSRDFIINYLKKCKALIFPSICYEGFPVTIVEALSTGTPIIASDHGSMSEIVENGVNGLHFIPGDVQDLISKIIQITDSDEFARKLCDNARLSYERLYTPERNYAELVVIYKNVLQNKESFKPGLQEYSLT
jgi:glycosyltransferase involved in cell wall biosynthesis